MSTPGDAQYSGGYHEYTGGIPGDVQYSGGYHEYTGGYHNECNGRYHEYNGHVQYTGGTMSMPGDVQYPEVSIFPYSKFNCFPNDLLQHLSWYPPVYS